MTGDNECYSVSGHAPPAAAEDRALTNETRGLPSVFVFLAALVFLLLTVPANHNEAEDAYFYARMAESGRGAELFHRHHLLYLPLARSFWWAARALGLVARAFPALIGLSAIAGAATVALVWRLFPRGGPLAALGLLFSYGFWRYSATVEIYAPLAALSVAAFFCAARAERRAGWAWGAIGFAAAALLTHLAAGPAVLAGIPILYAVRRQWARAFLHVAVVITLTVAVYGAILSGPGAVVYSDSAMVRPAVFSLRALLSALPAAGHTVLSGNFVFAFPSAAERLETLFPHQMLHEEIFMGRNAPAWVRWFAPVTGVAAAAAVAALWGGAVRRALRRRFRPERAEAAVFVGAAAWLAGAALLAFFFEATNPEMWIPALPALWVCVGCFAPPPGSANRKALAALPSLAIAALLAHNAAGGFAPIWRAEGDYARHKTEWIANHAGPGDWILTADSHSVVTFLQYRSEAFVLDGRFVGLSDWRRFWETRLPKRVWILGEFYHPPRALLNRPPPAESRRQELAEFLAPGVVQVHRDDRVAVFEWKAPKSATDEFTP